MPPWQAVVFDFDGVILQSMELHAEAYRRVLQPLGVAVKDGDVFQLEGATSEEIIRELLERSRKPAGDPHALANEKQRIYHGLQPRLYPGGAAMVQGVRTRVPRLGLVTGTRRENLAKFIPDLLPLFDAVVAAKDYTHGKPHPEPYLLAAKALGVAPSHAAVVENAVRGVQSARAAGYGFIVGLTTTMPRHALEEAGADVVVARHEDVAAALFPRQ